MTAHSGIRGSPVSRTTTALFHGEQQSFDDKRWEQRRHEGGWLGHPLSHDLAQVPPPWAHLGTGLAGVPSIPLAQGSRTPSQGRS